MPDPHQLPLWEGAPVQAGQHRSNSVVADLPALTEDSTMGAALVNYEVYLRGSSFSRHTATSFLHAIELLRRFLIQRNKRLGYTNTMPRPEPAAEASKPSPKVTYIDKQDDLDLDDALNPPDEQTDPLDMPDIAEADVERDAVAAANLDDTAAAAPTYEPRLKHITAGDLAAWVRSLRYMPGRARNYSEKSISVRISALRNFFTWLHNEKIITSNPATALPARHVSTRLPDILFDNEIELLLQHAQEYSAESHCLIFLLLHSGIKKEELLALRLNDIDLSNPNQPEIFIRSKYPHRQRRLKLPAEFTRILERHRQENNIVDTIYDGGIRNFNYIIEGIGQRAGLRKQVTPQILRDTFAVRELRTGTQASDLRLKLGLAEKGWPETISRYAKLAQPAL